MIIDKIEDFIKEIIYFLATIIYLFKLHILNIGLVNSNLGYFEMFSYNNYIIVQYFLFGVVLYSFGIYILKKNCNIYNDYIYDDRTAVLKIIISILIVISFVIIFVFLYSPILKCIFVVVGITIGMLSLQK